jgi:hypothetical protein
VLKQVTCVSCCLATSRAISSQQSCVPGYNCCVPLSFCPHARTHARSSDGGGTHRSPPVAQLWTMAAAVWMVASDASHTHT